MFSNLRLLDLLDILIVAYVVYRIIVLIRGTQAIQLLRGIFIILLALILSRWLQLRTIHWILQSFMAVGLIAIPIIFHPELRRALEQLGRGRFFITETSFLQKKDRTTLIEEIVRTVQDFSEDQIGSLIVIERETGLRDYAETGIELDAQLTEELLKSIFVRRSPLHDGAVIISGKRIAAAGCLLPLSELTDLRKDLGTRHRAALGLAEATDALIIVVSEETGMISLAHDGALIRDLTLETLRERLHEFYKPEDLEKWQFLKWGVSNE